MRPARPEPVGEAGAGVLLVDHHGHPAAARREVGGRRDVAAEADDDVHPLVDRRLRRRDRVAEPAGQAQEVDGGAPGQRHARQDAQVQAVRRHEVRLEPLRRAQHREPGVRVPAADLVRDGEQRVDVARRAAAGQQDVQRLSHGPAR